MRPVPPSPEDRRAIQPWPIRLTHWANVPLLALMAGSGLQILVAYPYLGAQGAQYTWHIAQGWVPPGWMRVGDWLAGSRHWHFGLAWLLLLNGVLYVAYLFGSGEWRRRLFFPRRDGRNAVHMFLYYLRLRRTAPEQGLYNGLQRLAYTGVLLLGIVQVLSGLAIYKPTQLWWLATLFGGYEPARAFHFYGLTALALFSVGHVLMVALHPRTLKPMVTGGDR